MQSHSLDVQLQRTLDELCADLFATPALDDCSAILQSLALLAETFPQAQTLLGRLLAQNDSNQPRYAAISKLSSLSTNFLYKKETACGAVSLLAALANNNERNQRRIVQSTTGVKLGLDLTRHGPIPALYALTVPAIATSTYRRWRKRQRELQNCRLPTGVPPTHDGVPMPCYCDDCLGAEQFLSTWQQHFHDLSRWSRDSDSVISTIESSSLPSLSTEDFFRVFLADHQLRVCTVEEALGHKKLEIPYSDTTNRHASLLYYFVPPEDDTAATPRGSVQFNPLLHLSAIAISTDVDVDVVRKAGRPHGTNQSESPPTNSVESIGLAAEQVILFTGTAEVKPCAVVRTNKYSESDDEGPPNCTVPGSEFLSEGFCRHEEQHVPSESLAYDISDEGCDLTETVQHLLLDMISFCDTALGGGHPQEEAPLSEPENLGTSPLQVRVVMTAKLSDQLLQIDCETNNTEDALPGSFSTRIAEHDLVDMSSTSENGGLSLLCLPDEALERLLERCRICTCDNAHEESDSVYLRPIAPDEKEKLRDAETNNETSQHATGNSTTKRYARIRVPLSGLSSEAKRDLARLVILVSEDRYLRLSTEDLTTMMQKMARVVADCNERISYLSSARDKELVRAASEAHRSAAIFRCRHCRDLLIQLGKKLALQVKALDESAPMPQRRLLRAVKIARSSIHDVLVRSEAFDPWETPDARVEKLNLDHRLWASGFPDAAYYQDTDMRQRENRKKQQQLSRKLLLQQKKNRLKNEARAKQHRA